MRKLYATLLVLAGWCTASYAGPGDTTIITAHTDMRMDVGQPWNYDSLVSLPDGSVKYRKILLEFSIGKYDCGGNYNPNNPGEGAGQTGWCADWDYDMMVYAKTPTDTVELGRVITPYGNSTMTRTPADWKHPYYFDVTDLYPILKNDVTLTIRYNAWWSGWTGSVRLLFIEGMPPRDVEAVTPLWVGSYAYGNAANPIDNEVTEKTIHFPAAATAAEMRVLITGHGMDAPGNCAEFCKKWYRFKVDGNQVAQQDIWRDDCGSNFLYPQSGTWIYNRSNWCPGDLVRLISHKVPSSVAPGQNFTVDMDFQPYNNTSGSASYKLGTAMVFYKGFNKTLDAGIEDIISPTNNETYFRQNPICGSPEIKIQNFGSSTITEVMFEYGIEGGTLSTYTHTTSLAPLATQQVLLPAIDAINLASGNDNKFLVRILTVNGSEDDDVYNNEMRSTFKAAPVWNGGNFAITLRTSSAVSNNVNRANWKIVDYDGNIVAQRSGTANSTTYNDTIALGNGCYKLELDCSYLGLGLRNPYHISSGSAGYLRMYDIITGSRLPLAHHDIGPNSAYQGPQEGWVGNGFTDYFRVDNAVSVDELSAQQFMLNVYPNPAKDLIQVEVYGQKPANGKATIRLVNLLGQTLLSMQTSDRTVSIPLSEFASGMYTLEYEWNGTKKTEKVVIAR